MRTVTLENRLAFLGHAIRIGLQPIDLETGIFPILAQRQAAADGPGGGGGVGEQDLLAPIRVKRLGRLEGVLHCGIFRKIGSRVQKPVNNHDRIGVIITRGKTREAALEAANHAMERLNLTIQ